MFKKRQRKAGQGAARRKRQHVEEEEEEEGEQAPREATTTEAGADEKAAAADPRAVGGEAAAGVGVAGDAGGGSVDGSDSDDWGGEPPSSAAADRAVLSDSERSSSPPAPAAGGGAPADTETKGDSVLPIAAHRDEIVAAVRANQFIVLVGETGSGKTTQLAQFLLDAGLATQEGHEGGIAVTQPRRVAAIGAAHRVASERGGGSVGGEVGYTVRLESECSAATRIKFLTDGCLLRECLLCPTLDQYSVVILDEAHERSVATDLMFTLLKKAAAKRPNMRVVVTSATLDHVKFAAYFNHCPSIIVPGRQFPVEVHWESAGGRGVKTANLARSVATAVVNLHMQEPRGHILGFLTGQAEVEKACSLVVSMLRELEELGEEPPEFDIWIMPCYGAMTASQQADIFKPVPDTTRKVILATNIAETSITVDGIRFVVDGGFVKHNTYMPSSGMSTLQVQRISRVEAQQRAGRAGRTGPGKCIRLYSHKDHAMMDAESKPEIQRTSLEDVVLCHLRAASVPIAIRQYMKELAIEDVLGVDFLDPPDRDGLVQACKQLFLLGALDRDGAITKQGRQIAKIPVEPALGRALLAAAAGDVLPETLTVVAMLGCEEGGGVWIRPGESRARAQADSARAHFARDGLGDQVALLRCYAEWLERGRHPRWCKEHWVHSRALSLCEKLRDLLLKSLRSAVGADERAGGGRLRFDRTTLQRLRQALCYGLYHLRVTSIPAGEES